ncbi:MAG: hypothetical protein IKK95_00845 [Lachnospiraceae bacterium]|nr:hypothetical protein [Lachnospiraceae bacterium]
MLQFLQTGKVLYVLATVCGLGVLSKLVTSSLYKRLIKDTGNMALTKSKNLRMFRQRTENMLMLSHGIKNTNAYIEKQLYSFRFMKLSLDGWDNLSVQAMILCFLIGGLAAFGAYWYRCDSYYIVLYGTMGILSGLFMVLVDNSVNVSLKRQQLMDCLVDYVDNTPHFFRSVDKSANVDSSDRRGKSVAEASKSRLREMGNKKLKVVEETAVGDTTAKGDRKKFLGLSRKKGKGEAISGGVGIERDGKVATEVSQELTHEEELRKSIDGLKQSLEQIAASRAVVRADVKTVSPKGQENGSSELAHREFSQEDLKFLGELLQEYWT